MRDVDSPVFRGRGALGRRWQGSVEMEWLSGQQPKNLPIRRWFGISSPGGKRRGHNNTCSHTTTQANYRPSIQPGPRRSLPASAGIRSCPSHNGEDTLMGLHPEKLVGDRGSDKTRPASATLLAIPWQRRDWAVEMKADRRKTFTHRTNSGHSSQRAVLTTPIDQQNASGSFHSSGLGQQGGWGRKNRPINWLP